MWASSSRKKKNEKEKARKKETLNEQAVETLQLTKGRLEVKGEND